MEAWIDAHNHLQDPRLGGVEPVLADMLRAGVSHAVVNATGEEDWLQVATLARSHPDRILPAFGVHPWKAGQVKLGWLERLEALLLAFPEASVGEIGLDRWVGSPDLAIQRGVFEDQLRLAREMERPVTIHCLKAWEDLFEAFAQAPPPARILLHSFSGSVEVARRLIPFGAYFSFSGYFLQPRKAKVLEVFRQLPRERILLETDAPDMAPPDVWVTHRLHDGLNHPANLPAIAAGLAEALGMNLGDLSALTRANTAAFLGR